MKPTVGQKVIDSWFFYWGIGVCVKALKTRWHIKFGPDIIVYDKPHIKFLVEA